MADRIQTAAELLRQLEGVLRHVPTRPTIYHSEFTVVWIDIDVWIDVWIAVDIGIEIRIETLTVVGLD